jgi:hypothetical protein
MKTIAKMTTLMILSLILWGCNEIKGEPFGQDYADAGVEWQLNTAMSDEFETWNPDKWGTQLWYGITSDFSFKDENVYVEDGILRLAAKKESYNGKQYTCGAAMSKYEVGGNVAIEIRAKTIDNRANVTTALWLSDNLTADKNPNVEIDIMETLWVKEHPYRFSATVHNWLVPGGDNALGWVVYDEKEGKSISDEWHVWRLERLENYIRLYLDGEPYWEFETDISDDRYNVSHQPRRVIFSVEGHAGAPVDEFLPGEFLIDYIRVYDAQL